MNSGGEKYPIHTENGLLKIQKKKKKDARLLECNLSMWKTAHYICKEPSLVFKSSSLIIVCIKKKTKII